MELERGGCSRKRSEKRHGEGEEKKDLKEYDTVVQYNIREKYYTCQKLSPHTGEKRETKQGGLVSCTLPLKEDDSRGTYNIRTQRNTREWKNVGT